jgi:hypothetical protein
VFTPFHKPPYPYPYGRSVDETMTGAVIRTREVYRRRGEDLSDIGKEYNKK